MCLLSFFICRNKKFEPPTAERRMLQANLDKEAISTIYNIPFQSDQRYKTRHFPI